MTEAALTTLILDAIGADKKLTTEFEIKILENHILLSKDKLTFCCTVVRQS